MKIYIGFWSKPFFYKIDLLKEQNRHQEIDAYVETIKNCFFVNLKALNSDLELHFLTDTEGEAIINDFVDFASIKVDKMFDKINHISPAFDGYEKFFAIKELSKKESNFVYLDYLFHLPNFKLPSNTENLFIETKLINPTFHIGQEVPADRSKEFLIRQLNIFTFSSFLQKFNSIRADKNKTFFNFGILEFKNLKNGYLSDIIIPNNYLKDLVFVSKKVLNCIDQLQDYFDEEEVLDHLYLAFNGNKYFLDIIFSLFLEERINKKGIEAFYYIEDKLSQHPAFKNPEKNKIFPISYLKSIDNTFKFEPSKVLDWQKNLSAVQRQRKNIEEKNKNKEKNKEKKQLIEDQKVLKERVNGPSLFKMAGNFATAMKDFAKSGFLKVTEDQYNARMNICNGCEFWQDDARMGMGKCLKCGCTGAKQWIATSVCPINKWGAISKEEVEASIKEMENAQTEKTQSTVSQQTDGSSQEPSPEAQG